LEAEFYFSILSIFGIFFDGFLCRMNRGEAAFCTIFLNCSYLIVSILPILAENKIAHHIFGIALNQLLNIYVRPIKSNI